MNISDKIFVAGHKGLVGSSLVRELSKRGYTNILTVDKNVVDLKDQKSVNKWFSDNSPDYVFLAAAKVGGIQANNIYPAEFIHDNLSIQNNVIHACHDFKVKKLIFLGSVCIYPKYANQQLRTSFVLKTIL